MEKKPYTRPQITFDDLGLGATLSSGCEGIANIGETQCSVTIPGGFASYDCQTGMSIFSNDMICQYVVPSGGDRPCYHAPSEMNNVFSS